MPWLIVAFTVFPLLWGMPSHGNGFVLNGETFQQRLTAISGNVGDLVDTPDQQSGWRCPDQVVVHKNSADNIILEGLDTLAFPGDIHFSNIGKGVFAVLERGPLKVHQENRFVPNGVMKVTRTRGWVLGIDLPGWDPSASTSPPLETRQILKIKTQNEGATYLISVERPDPQWAAVGRRQCFYEVNL